MLSAKGGKKDQSRIDRLKNALGMGGQITIFKKGSGSLFEGEKRPRGSDGASRVAKGRACWIEGIASAKALSQECCRCVRSAMGGQFR